MAVGKPTCRRNIVVCSDGTGNAGGRGKGSNVWRIRQAMLRHTDGHMNSQVVLYEDGVGTQALAPIRILGNVFGLGITQDLKLLYGKLIREFNIYFDESDQDRKRPLPDELYLFGFSRGAFAIRTLANILYHCGIADIRDANGTRRTPEEIDQIVEAAIRAYARRVWHPKGPEEFRKAFGIRWQPDNCKLTAAQVQGRFPVRFVGVWDTVDAVGLPFDNFSEFLTNWGCPGFRLNMRRSGKYNGWEDDDLHDWIDNAYHAISVDDERQTFHPVLFLELDENGVHKGTKQTVLSAARDQSNDNEAARLRRVEQVWFPGVHSNLGGGYLKDHMAHVSLKWMMRHASREGLKFDRQIWHEYEQESDVLGHMYDSRGGLGAMYRYKPRSVSELSAEVGLDCTSDDRKPRIHKSVFQRIKEGATDYGPISLPLEPEYLEVEEPRTLKKQADATGVWEYDKREFSEKSEPVKHPHVPEPTGIREQAKQLTKNLVARRTFLFYALYAWVLSFIGVGIWLSRRTESRGEWLESTGAELYWLPYFAGFAAAGLIVHYIRHFFFRPIRGERVTVKTSYNVTRVIRNTCLLTAVLIALRPLCVNIIFWMTPGIVAPVIAGVGQSTIAFTIFGVCYYLISAGRMATIKLVREINVSAWMNAMGVESGRHRHTAWLKSTSMSQSGFWGWLSGFFESVVSPLLPLMLLAFISIGAVVSSICGVVTDSNVTAGREIKPLQLDSAANNPNAKTLRFVTGRILATGKPFLKEGWEYKVTVTIDETDEMWKDGSFEASPDGLKKPEGPADGMMESVIRYFKRKPGENYFQLLGSIGDPGATPIVIKSGQPFTATKSGELFLYVNDVPGSYRDNTGTAQVTIELVND